MFGGSSKSEKEPLDVVAKLAELRAALTEKVNGMVSDEDCHRFLTARQYDITKSLDMINKWAVWYETPLNEYKMDKKDLCPKDLLLIHSDEKEHLSTEAFLWSNTGEDREGRPIYFEKTGYCASRYSEIKKNFSEDEMFVRHIRQQETMVDRLKKASEKYGRPITKQVAILDLKGLPFAPDSMGFRVIHRSIVIDEACYPERLEKLFVINAPIYFTAIWAIVKPWIDAVTVKKIQIIGSNFQDILKAQIAEDQLPVEYGGTKVDFPWQHPAHNEGYITGEETSSKKGREKEGSAKEKEGDVNVKA